MKIWFLTSETPNYNPGGIARYIDNFARYLADAGHQVTVISRSDHALEQEIVPGYRLVLFRHRCNEPWDENEDLPTRQPQFPFNLLDYWTALSFQFADEVRSLCERLGPPDIIESQDYNAIAYYLQQRKLTEPGFLEGVPVLINAHSPDFILRHCNEEPAFQFPAYWVGQLEKTCFYAADAIISPSRYLAGQLESLLPDLSVEAYPLPWTDVSQIAENVGCEEGSVLYYGRLEVRKGVLSLLQEADRMWGDGADFRLCLIGSDCSYEPRGTTVEAYIRKKYGHHIESGRLEIPGPMEHGELLLRIRRAAVVVIPSIWENWPNTCIEAMSLGRVVVASVHGGQAEMIGDDGTAGLLFSWDEPGSMRAQLEHALSFSADQRERIGSAAKQRIAEHCDPAKVVPARVRHFQRVIDGVKGPPNRFPFLNEHLRNSDVHQRMPEINSVGGRVSAVVPCYNMGAYIEDTVASIFASDYPDIEVLIVDDGSDAPDTRVVLERICERFGEKVKVVRQQNRGLALARNRGAEEATGQFMILVDADDQIEPTYISRAVDLLTHYENVFIVFSWEQYFDDSSDVFPGWNLEFPYLLGHNQTCPVCVVDRAAWLAFGRNKSKFAYNFEDYESWVSMVAAGCGGVCIHETLTRYRIRGNGLWQDSGRRQHLFLYDLLVKEHPELYQKYGAELFCLQNANGSAQEWIKPSAYSPYDRRLEWEASAIRELREHCQNLDRQLKSALQRAENAERTLAENMISTSAPD